jgi:GMP synthase-like glutamine amidotransferase
VKPVLILQHIDRGGPGLFAEFLRENDVPFEIRRPDRGAKVPGERELKEFSGVCLCGGTQSANDPHPWIRAELELVRAAAAREVPVIGHCLGGQLISKGLGGDVTPQIPVEFGWHALRPVPGPVADDWLGELGPGLTAMQWHNERFTLPAGATPLLEGEYCRHQAFVVGRMLGMQFHVELDEPLIRHWAGDLRPLIPAPGASVQTAAAVLEKLGENYPRSRALARRLYARWLHQVA